MTKEEAIEIIKETRFDINTKINGTTRFSQALEIAIYALERDETVTEFADRCKECGARYGKMLKQKTGRWIIIHRNGKNIYVCSECNNEPLLIGENYPIFKLSDYCPYCGAKMEAVKND